MQNWITSFMENFGYLGTFLMILLENVFPPIPSEVVLTFGGFMTTTTKMTVPGVVLYATIGSVLGATILYGIGNIFNVTKLEKLIDRWGHVLKIKVSDIEKATSWFNKHGNGTIFFCRMVPLIRSLISITAGMSNMKFSLFAAYTTAGTLIWNILLVCAGAALGSSWEKIIDLMHTYSTITYLILGIAFVIILGLWFYKRNSKFKPNEK